MKIRAIQSQPSRALRDAPDLELLLKVPGLDQNEAREYFRKAGLLELYERLQGQGG